MSEDVLKITITAAGQQAQAELQKVAQYVDKNGNVNWKDFLLGKQGTPVRSIFDPTPAQQKQDNAAILGVPYAQGGTVPGPIGMPRLAIVHGGERYLGSPGSAAAASSGGTTRAMHVSQTFNIGSVDSRERVDEIYSVARRALADALAQ